MKSLRSFQIGFALVGVLILIAGGWLLWRNAHPVLSDPEQIEANLHAMSEAAKRHSSAGILNYLAKGFTWNGTDRHDVASNLSGLLFEFDVVEMKTSQVQVQLRGETATTIGNYDMTVRQRKASQAHEYSGRFYAEWAKQGGQWMITKATTEGESPL